MKQTYIISPTANAETLVDLHNEILAHNPSIRPINRWGSFTEYSIVLKRREAAGIIGPVPEDERAWRIVFGSERIDGTPELVIDVQFFDRGQHMWETAMKGATREEAHATVDRAIAWLSEHHPAAEALVEIDGRLLA